jgi:phospholipid/cholesterol/gamma-HCH transport system substrate-binding protein
LGDDRLHTRVGVVTLLLLGTAVALTLLLQGRHLRPGIRVHVEMERIGALTEGGLVRVAGRDIGTIDRVRLLPLDHAASYADDPTAERARIVLEVWIDRRYRHWVRENSEWFQNQPSVLGEAYLEVGPPPGGAEPGPPLADGARVRGVDPPRLDRIMQKSYENLRNVTDLLRDGLPEARELGRELDAMSQELDALADPAAIDAIVEGRRRLWKEALLAWDAAQASGVTPERARSSWARGRAAIARMRAQLAPLRAKLEHVLAELGRIEAQLGPERYQRVRQVMERTEALVARAEAILVNVEAIVAMVERGEGSIGAFLADTELADEFKAMSKVIKQTPWETIGHPVRKPGRPD